jgi:hypothetical protein
MMYLFQEFLKSGTALARLHSFFLAELIYRGIDDEGGDVGG